MTSPHQRRMAELQAMRAVIADLDRLVATTTVGTVPRDDVADVFERHLTGLPEDSGLLQQFNRLATSIRRGPARTRAEGLRQISLKLRIRADEFANIVEARDARLRPKG